MHHGQTLATMMLLAFGTLSCTAPQAIAKPQAAGDFDNDGIDDLVVGIEGKKVGTQAAAGEVQIVFGTINGLRFGNDYLLNQASPGSSDTAEAGDRFGRVVAVGDFDGDGFADLAVGVPLEDVSGAVNAGMVHVFYGSANGPLATTDQVWTQNSAGLDDIVDDGDLFGAALAVGDFDGDGFDDLAIGSPGETLSDIQPHAGVVFVIYGSNFGLDGSSAQFWSQNSASIMDVPEANDHFGAALAAGDFNGDGRSDLAIGVPGESINTIAQAGGVNVIMGSAVGLTATNNQFWSQNSTNVEDVAETGDHFGQALVAGDFNGDGRDELAIGVPDENVNGFAHAGAVEVLRGSPTGLIATADQFWTQDSVGVPDTAQANDRFGFALAAGDFDNDGRVDLFIGAPGESLTGAGAGAGTGFVMYGSDTTGLTTAGSKLWNQDTAGMKDAAAAGDAFGEALCVGDFNGDGFADVCIGIPLKDVGTQADAGAIAIIYGSAAGLHATGNQFINQNTQNAEGVAKQGDHFGGQRMDLF